MPLPPITLSKHEPIRLVSPYDDAIDLEATPADVIAAYARCDDLDASQLSIKPGAEPTWFTVRALGPREVRAVSALIPWTDAPADVTDRSTGDVTDQSQPTLADLAWAHEAHTQYLRFGLVAVDGLEGWESIKRETYLGIPVWPVDAVAALHSESAMWLGSAVTRLSRLEKKTASRSGS